MRSGSNQRRGSRGRGGVAALLLTTLLSTALLAGYAGAAPSSVAPAHARPLVVKVLVINLFSLEAAPWIAALKPTRDIPVPGLSSDYPYVKCNADAVCQMTTGMGHANAAAAVMAVLFSRLLDLRQTYFLIAGIAGIDPAHGTLGSAAWARYIVDAGIAHEIDARELPKGWSDGYFGVLTNGPNEVPKLEYHTEVFRLDEALLQQALALSRGAKLADAADLEAYRSHYPQAAAHDPPTVIQCDTLSGDTWWTGRRLGEHATRWMRLLTDGKGVYCTTQEEDNAVLNALTRASDAKLIDLRRVADLRTGSDFDRPYPGQQALAALLDQRALADAVTVAADNLVHAGMPLVATIVAHWEEWQHGVPGQVRAATINTRPPRKQANMAASR
jgi:purine nucleoside permease